MLVGVTPAEQYGIRLAELMGFPPSVLATARTAAQQLLAERKVPTYLSYEAVRVHVCQKNSRIKILWSSYTDLEIAP